MTILPITQATESARRRASILVVGQILKRRNRWSLVRQVVPGVEVKALEWPIKPEMSEAVGE